MIMWNGWIDIRIMVNRRPLADDQDVIPSA